MFDLIVQYAYIIYITLKNKFYPHDVNYMRESLDRSLDRGAQAYRFGELVDRYGREKWLEPLLDQIAPFIRLQLGDLVAFLEITRKYARLVSLYNVRKLIVTELLLLARPPENRSHIVLFLFLSTRRFAYRCGVLHEDRMVYCDQRFLPLLADS